jgi:5'-methylthioadenosine phosphorylase
VTDYDCWHESHESVSTDMVIDNLQKNCRAAQEIIIQTVKDLQSTRNCLCGEALKYALITDKTMIPAEIKSKMECIIGKYLM